MLASREKNIADLDRGDDGLLSDDSVLDRGGLGLNGSDSRDGVELGGLLGNGGATSDDRVSWCSVGGVTVLK